MNHLLREKRLSFLIALTVTLVITGFSQNLLANTRSQSASLSNQINQLSRSIKSNNQQIANYNKALNTAKRQKQKSRIKDLRTKLKRTKKQQRLTRARLQKVKRQHRLVSAKSPNNRTKKRLSKNNTKRQVKSASVPQAASLEVLPLRDLGKDKGKVCFRVQAYSNTLTSDPSSPVCTQLSGNRPFKLAWASSSRQAVGYRVYYGDTEIRANRLLTDQAGALP